MKKLFGLMAAAALATTAGLAMAEEGAQQQQQPQQGAAQQQQQGAGQQQGMQQHKQQQQRGQKMAQAGIGRHEVTGRIVDIDKQKGDVKVQTDRGQLDFYFPPASLQNYNQGDEVRLDVVLRPAQPQQQQQRQQGQQPKQQQQK
ncbi:hypothetical protein [Polyangium sp. y55x31]|uniref:hypothetical protein n=1 Tax=Polyangium sp. y55x31 TaxID=3042688 RepID=UPI002482FBA0|nr:hypothetical protein [Polyangium sp. y55x31]MDI1476613.1 hypothetical protein [Polyangium sp. y55x31]